METPKTHVGLETGGSCKSSRDESIEFLFSLHIPSNDDIDNLTIDALCCSGEPLNEQTLIANLKAVINEPVLRAMKDGQLTCGCTLSANIASAVLLSRSSLFDLYIMFKG